MTVLSRNDKNTKGRRAVWKVLKSTLEKKGLNGIEGKKHPFLSHKNYKATIHSLKVFRVW